MRTEGVGERRLLSIADQNQLRGILKFMFYVRSDCPVEADQCPASIVRCYGRFSATSTCDGEMRLAFACPGTLVGNVRLKAMTSLLTSLRA